MKVSFTKVFLKDLKQTPKDIQQTMKSVVDDIESSNKLIEIRNCKKLQGSDNAYRIRIRDYRATFLFIHIDDKVFFQRILTRGQIYKKHN